MREVPPDRGANLVPNCGDARNIECFAGEVVHATEQHRCDLGSTLAKGRDNVVLVEHIAARTRHKPNDVDVGI